MNAAERRDLELLAAIKEARRAVREAEAVVKSKELELVEARKQLRERKLHLEELQDESVDGTPDMPLVRKIAENQDARDEQKPEASSASGDLSEIEMCLKHSLNELRQDDWKIWHEYPDAMTDAEVWAVIRRVWPAGERHIPAKRGEVPRSYAVMGGPTPKFWIDGRRSPSDAPTFEGPALLAKVRWVMELMYREPTAEERLDQALLHVLTTEPYGFYNAAGVMEGLDDDEIIDVIKRRWPSEPTALRFADEPESRGFTISAEESPFLALGDITGDGELDDGPEGHVTSRYLPARVRKVLGIETPHLLDPDEPDAIRPWTGADLENALDDLVVRTRLAAWNRGGDQPTDSDLSDEIRGELGGFDAKVTLISAKESGGHFSYAYEGGLTPRLWIDPPADIAIPDIFKGLPKPTLTGNKLRDEIRKALNRDYPRPFEPKPTKPKSRAKKAAAK